MNKKIIKILAVIAVIFSTSALADDGFRFGLGVSGIASDSGDYESDTTVKVEAGYDFNQIVGLHTSYEQVDGNNIGLNFDGGSFKVGLDVGYKIQLGIIDLKPYAKAGINFTSFSIDNGFDTYTNNESTAYYGVGARGSFMMFYMDIAAESTDTVWGDKDSTGSVTFGLIF